MTVTEICNRINVLMEKQVALVPDNRRMTKVEQQKYSEMQDKIHALEDKLDSILGRQFQL